MASLDIMSPEGGAITLYGEQFEYTFEDPITKQSETFLMFAHIDCDQVCVRLMNGGKVLGIAQFEGSTAPIVIDTLKNRDFIVSLAEVILASFEILTQKDGSPFIETLRELKNQPVRPRYC